AFRSRHSLGACMALPPVLRATSAATSNTSIAGTLGDKALRIGADFLVTRNARDYRGAPVDTRAAGEVVVMLRRPAE
ncbi:MAG: hypothetical protein ACT4P6_20635, partial [Gemmatimonadaceae bacterium]